MFFLSLPSCVFAGTYGNGPYDAGVYGTGYVAPVSSGGGGGSGGSLFPVAPIFGAGGVVSFDPGTTTTPSVPAPDALAATTAATVAALQAQIKTLLAQIAALGGGGPVTVSFTRDLTLGSTGTDVHALQVLLNTYGYIIAKAGGGSPGNETTYFGTRTQAALIKFQKAKGITPAAGYLGPKTRTVLNQR